MAVEKVIIKNINPVLVLGVNDKHLKLIEDFFPVSITARGDEIVLKGDDKYVEKVRRIFSEILSIIDKKGFVKERDLETLIDIELEGKSVQDSVTPESVILFRKNKPIKPRTPNQEKYYQSTLEDDIVFAIGPAGTGKTYLGVAIAVSALKRHEVKRIILTRPAVEAGESLGYLPGDLKEKIKPYLAPLYDSLMDMFAPDKVQSLMNNQIVEVVPLAYMRGRTLNNAFVILDEAQNTTEMQMKMFLTRLGSNSKAIVTGDVTQIDLHKHEKSGLIQAERLLSDIKGIDFIYFNEKDVVRHRLVKEIIKAYKKEKANKEQDKNQS